MSNGAITKRREAWHAISSDWLALEAEVAEAKIDAIEHTLAHIQDLEQAGLEQRTVTALRAATAHLRDERNTLREFATDRRGKADALA